MSHNDPIAVAAASCGYCFSDDSNVVLFISVNRLTTSKCFSILSYEYIKDKREYRKNEGRVFAIILGLCDETMKNRIQSLSEYDKMETSLGPRQSIESDNKYRIRIVAQSEYSALILSVFSFVFDVLER
jgi:hypothetical protein